MKKVALCSLFAEILVSLLANTVDSKTYQRNIDNVVVTYGGWRPILPGHPYFFKRPRKLDFVEDFGPRGYAGSVPEPSVGIPSGDTHHESSGDYYPLFHVPQKHEPKGFKSTISFHSPGPLNFRQKKHLNNEIPDKVLKLQENIGLPSPPNRGYGRPHNVQNELDVRLVNNPYDVSLLKDPRISGDFEVIPIDVIEPQNLNYLQPNSPPNNFRPSPSVSKGRPFLTRELDQSLNPLQFNSPSAHLIESNSELKEGKTELIGTQFAKERPIHFTHAPQPSRENGIQYLPLHADKIQALKEIPAPPLPVGTLPIKQSNFDNSRNVLLPPPLSHTQTPQYPPKQGYGNNKGVDIPVEILKPPSVEIVHSGYEQFIPINAEIFPIDTVGKGETQDLRNKQLLRGHNTGLPVSSTYEQYDSQIPPPTPVESSKEYRPQVPFHPSQSNLEALDEDLVQENQDHLLDIPLVDNDKFSQPHFISKESNNNYHNYNIENSSDKDRGEQSQVFHAYYAPADHKAPPGYVKLSIEEFNKRFKDADIQYVDDPNEKRYSLGAQESQSDEVFTGNANQNKQSENSDKQVSETNEFNPLWSLKSNKPKFWENGYDKTFSSSRTQQNFGNNTKEYSFNNKTNYSADFAAHAVDESRGSLQRNSTYEPQDPSEYVSQILELELKPGQTIKEALDELGTVTIGGVDVDVSDLKEGEGYEVIDYPTETEDNIQQKASEELPPNPHYIVSSNRYYDTTTTLAPTEEFDYPKTQNVDDQLPFRENVSNVFGYRIQKPKNN
ncbi:uncharacterized protein LOC143239532 [Tachypleus tridentatus]|uniref:uncharacterized protein LOC143239532 n=1 Tax=Tachypleus tridentatus TaxID=6853 RepID=UPI003FD4DEF1